MGRGTVGTPEVVVYRGDVARVEIGCFAAIGPDVEIVVGGNHRIDWVTSYPFREWHGLPGAYHENPWSKGDIFIGHAAVLGPATRVLSGVTIGVGAEVLPSSVVTRDVAGGTVVSGNPARPVGQRVPEEAVRALESLPWATAPVADLVAQVGALTGRPAAELSPALSPRTSPSIPPLLRRRVHGSLSRLVTEVRAGQTALQQLMGRSESPPPGPEQAGVEMGQGSYSCPRVVWDGTGSAVLGRVLIGKYSSLAEGCEVVARLAPAASRPGLAAEPVVVVGNDVWVGRGARLMGPVTVGDGAVVAAYSVVTSDVGPYAVVAGNPARQLGSRFPTDIVSSLIRIQWWNWPEDVILQRWQQLCSDRVEDFAAAYDPGRQVHA